MLDAKSPSGTRKKWQRDIRNDAAEDFPGYNGRVAHKGHFVVYTIDENRFEVPLKYISTPVFVELLKMSEEEFGLENHSRLILPCDSALMEHILALLHGRVHGVRNRLLDYFPILLDAA